VYFIINCIIQKEYQIFLGVILHFVALKTSNNIKIRKIKKILFIILFCQLLIINSFASDPPYHAINGFGTNTKGGTVGTVVKVTNLNKSGPGSLAEAVSSANRLVVFEVGGIINLENGEIRIADSNITIAGQTAPYPGIFIIRGSLALRANNIIVQHIAVRPGELFYTPVDAVSATGDGISVTGENNVLDHCSITWATDENTSVGIENITFYRCIIAEGLSYSIPGFEHSCGTLIYENSENISIIGCLYAHNFRRNPRIKNGVSVFWANNITYNYGIYAAHIGDEFYPRTADEPNCGKGTFVGNTCLKGIDGWDNNFLEGHKGDRDKTTSQSGGIAYMNDNLLIDRLDSKNKLLSHDESIILATEPISWPDGFIAAPSDSSLFNTLKSVGARAGERDTIDSRIVNSVILGTGKIIDSVHQVGGYPTYEPTSRTITVPSDINKRLGWLDSLSAAIDTDHKLDVSPLENFLDTFLTNFPPDTTQLTKFTCNPLYAGIDTIKYSYDSLVITETILLPSDTVNLTTTTCNPMEVGYDTLFLTNQEGCDSIIITETTLLPSDTVNITETITLGESYQIGDSVFTETGSYTVTLANQYGCDSLITLNLAVEEPVNTISINEQSTQIKVYPNPTEGIIYLTIKNSKDEVSINIFYQTGQIIFSREYLPTQGRMVEKIDLKNYPNGIYFIEVASGKFTKVEKLILNN